MKTIAPSAGLQPISCSLHTITPELIMLAERYFPSLYLEQLEGRKRYYEGVAARYLVSRLIDHRFGVKDYFPESTPKGIPVFPENLYWSIAYADQKAFVATDDKPVGVDIERVVMRNPLLFSVFSPQEWRSMGKMDWNQFYKMWTAKQALLKKNHSETLDTRDMTIVGARKDSVWIASESSLHTVTVRKRKGYIVAIA